MTTTCLCVNLDNPPSGPRSPTARGMSIGSLGAWKGPGLAWHWKPCLALIVKVLAAAGGG